MNEKVDTEKMIVDNILIELIDWEGQTVREAVDDDHVVELAMSITKKGLLEPIVVKKKEDGRFQGCAGFHRCAAMSRLGRYTVPANIREGDDTPVKALALIENIIRRDMTVNEEVKAVAYLNKEEGLSPSQICDLIGKGRSWVDRRLMIPSLPDDVRKELMDGHITIGAAEVIGNVKQDNIRAVLLNQVITAHLTQRQTEELTKLYLETDSIPIAIAAGEEKAREIQAQTTPVKECYTCKTHHRLDRIRFIPVCLACESYFLAHFVEHEKEKEEQKDAG